ncbi:hypothetical protein [Virgibacillus halodenitrificans]|uniref:hypothetical protein n=1 Tax=Virgibacillus halodenitrificans TaxID=1482 RepID=UPI000EF4C534|nr:hypothetical protein [Virgibacillus halodenitrificans]
MNRKRIAIIVIVLIGVVSTIIYLSMTGRFQMGEEINVREKAQTIQEELLAIQEAAERETNLITQFDKMNDSDLDGISDSYINYFGSPKKMVEYVFGTLSLNDGNLFISAFDTNTALEDLSEGKSYEEKKDLINEMMNRLSRNGKLTEVYLISSDTYSEKANANILIIYEDGKEVKMTLEFSVYEDPHDASHQKNYYVSSSIWELIEQVESEG